MTDFHSHVEQRPVNWLPIPGLSGAKEKREVKVDENDFFRKGEIASYYPGQGSGVIATDKGERLPFDLRGINMIGDLKDIDAGIRVGYDVSRTSGGYKITCIKVY
ncbi:MAG: hypothetical protein ABH871_08700 [Pseudomonadota bacterium]